MRVWVTGAGSGMGRAAAVAAAERRAQVALTGRRPDALAATAAEVREAGGEPLVLATDVTDRDAVAAAHDELTRTWGGVDALVLAAGLNDPDRRWDDQTMAGFDAVLATNLTAVATMIDRCLPDLRRTGGQVVVISSYAGWRFSPGAGVAYSASKSALASLCQTLNAAEAVHGVRACHLCPGDVDTDFLDLRPAVPDAAARAVMLTAADVGRVVGFVLDAPPHVRIDELVISPISQT